MIDRKRYQEIQELLMNNKVHTVCIEANCPNRYECFSEDTATFLILGNVCTRNCAYCNIKHGVPSLPDENEIGTIVDTVKKLGIRYVVITSVTRDDLEDGGVRQFCEVTRRLHEVGCKVEVLIPDYGPDLLNELIEAGPEVINHNIETIKENFPKFRAQGSYVRSLKTLRYCFDHNIKTKSGLMVGLGESFEQIKSTLKDLRDCGVEMITIGQYLPPSKDHAICRKVYNESEFQRIKDMARQIGFEKIECGKMVRSSYHAKEMASD